MGKNKDKIYYYTSNYVLLEWLKSEKIWATKSVTSNDSSDTRYITRYFDKLKDDSDFGDLYFVDKTKKLVDSIGKVSLRKYKDILIEFINNHFLEFEQIVNESRGRSDIFKKILLQLTEEEVKEYFNIDYETFKDIREELIYLQHPYIISFSYNKDDRFLWESYTNNEGVCLEFDKNELRDYFDNYYKGEESISKFLCKPIMEDIKYEKEEQSEFIKYIIKNTTQSKEKDRIRFLMYISIFCKAPFWKPENEFRLAFLVPYLSKIHVPIKENYDLKYKNEYKTQDYIEVPIPRLLSKSTSIVSLLKGIITGPMNSEANLKKYIRNSLKKEMKGNSKLKDILLYFDGLKIEESSGKDIIRR